VVFKGQKRYNGVAIASLEKPETVSFGLDDKGPTDEDRLLSGVFSGIPVVNTYVPQDMIVKTPVSIQAPVVQAPAGVFRPTLLP